MEPFDLTQSDYSLTGTVTVMCVIAVMTVGLSYASFKLPRLRPMLEGEPIVLVEDGRIIERNLRRQRMTVAEVAAEARLQQIGSLAEVRFAVLETNGQLSFIPTRPA